MKTILLTGGGTAGHVTPNLALMERFRDKKWISTMLAVRLASNTI